MLTTAERITPRPHLMLTNEGWGKVSDRFGLPPESREAINATISVLVISANTAAAYSPSDTRKNLIRAAERCAKLVECLEDLRSDSLALACIAIEISGKEVTREIKDRALQRNLDAEIRSLNRLQAILVGGSEKVVKARPGGHTAAVCLALFISMLDEIVREYTGAPLKRDSKGYATGRDMIDFLCKAAGQDISAHSIDEAMRSVIKGRGGNTNKSKS